MTWMEDHTVQVFKYTEKLKECFLDIDWNLYSNKSKTTTGAAGYSG